MGKFIDITGQRFGRLIAKEYVKTEKKGSYWLCVCDCGNQKLVKVSKLRSGHTQSCGCLQRERTHNACYKDLTGQCFGRLTVIGPALPSASGRTRFQCKCVCGKIVNVEGGNLVSGATKSCGCIRREITRKLKLSHGMVGTRIYRCWMNMRSRCLNPKNKEFSNYGGRGISICKEWNDFSAFYNWATLNGYRDDLTIDRIDVDKGYCPQNCRWANRYTQSRNRTDNVYITIDGKTMIQEDWAKELNVSSGLIRYRRKKYPSIWNPRLIREKDQVEWCADAHHAERPRDIPAPVSLIK